MSSFWSKLKPNILIVASQVAFLTGLFGWWLIDRISGELVSSEILALLVGIGIGGLIALAGQLATDNPPNHHRELLEYFKAKDKLNAGE